MIGKILIGAGAVAALMGLPVWRDMHHQGKAQSGWGILRDQLVIQERAKHISARQAVINAKARYSLGIDPREVFK